MIQRSTFIGLVAWLCLAWLPATEPILRIKQYPEENPSPGSSLQFIENLGQWDERIEYRVKMAGGDLFLEEDKLTYSFYQLPEKHAHGEHTPMHIHLSRHGHGHGVIKRHAFHVEFPGANFPFEWQTQDTLSAYNNYYYGDDPLQWVSKVPLSTRIQASEMFEGISIKMYGYGDAVKYDFVVQPGADPQQIKLRYKGVDDIFIRNKSLVIKTSIAELEELPPIAFQYQGDAKIVIPCAYHLENNILSYEFPEGYDSTSTLIIDPTLIFSTHTASRSDNWGFTATYDQDGNAYAGGIQFGLDQGSLYPTTIGAFESEYQGGNSDATITKFSANGDQLIFSTYLGGESWDQPHSLIVDDNNELVVFGRTSSFDFPTSASAFQRSLAGDNDIFVTRFNSDGTQLIGSTFLGGSADDGVNGNDTPYDQVRLKFNYGDDARGEVILDDAGNVLIASCTQSVDFPVNTGAFQRFFGGGQDGVVAKFNSNLSQLMWSSFLGGNDDDAVYTLKIDSEGNIYGAGGTMSRNFPGTLGGYFSDFRGGLSDGFITKISSNGNQILQSTYLGTNDYDQAYLLEIDDDNDVYVSGQTNGDYPVIDPVIGALVSDRGANQFITKMNPDLNSIIYSTTFGTINASVPNISPTAFLVDRCENVYVTGWGGIANQENGGTTDGLFVSGDAVQGSTDGSDIYLIVFSKDIQERLYATYLGADAGNDPGLITGEHVDGGTSRFDKNGVIYHAVCAACGGTPNFPTTPGVWGPENSSNNCNLAIFKMEFDLAGIEASFLALDEDSLPVPEIGGCAPLNVLFENNSVEVSANTRYLWDFGDGSPVVEGKEPSHVFTDSGVYNVRLIIEDLSSCNERDTTFQRITVVEPQTADAGEDQVLCMGDSLSLQGSGGVTYQWEPVASLSNPSIANPIASPTATTTYTLTIIDDQGCTSQDQVTITVDPGPDLSLSGDTSVCIGGQAQLSAVSSDNIASFSWRPSNLLLDPSLATVSSFPLDTVTTFYVDIVNVNGCRRTDSITVDVFEIFVNEDTSICEGQSVQLDAIGPAVSYSWTPITGLSDPNIANPIASSDITQTYTLEATSAEGCVSIKSVTVTLNPLPPISAGTDQELCLGDSAVLTATSSASIASYNWTPAASLTTPNSVSTLAFPAQSITYSIEVTDTMGCINTDSLRITVLPMPDVNAGLDTEICFGDDAQLGASGAISYSWSPQMSLSDANSANPVAAPLQTTIYTVEGIDAMGCTNTDEVEVMVVSAPETQVSASGTLCINGEITLRGEGGVSYLWSTGERSQEIRVIPDQTTRYWVVSSSNACEGDTAYITVEPNADEPIADFDVDTTMGFAPMKVDFENASQFATQYIWDFGTGDITTEENPSYTFNEEGTYTVQLVARTAFGCVDTISREFVVDIVRLYVPNAFTPNGDGTNNNFVISQNGFASFQIRIFSRWGMEIFASEDPEFAWNGFYKGQAVPEGVYTYIIKGTGENGIPYEHAGTITLIR